MIIDIKNSDGTLKKISVVLDEIKQELIEKCGEEIANRSIERGGFKHAASVYDLNPIVEQLNSGMACEKLGEFYLY